MRLGRRGGRPWRSAASARLRLRRYAPCLVFSSRRPPAAAAIFLKYFKKKAKKAGFCENKFFS